MSQSRNDAMAWMSAFAAVLACNTASSQPAKPAEGPLYLDQVTITATRNPIPTFDNPGMVTVIDRNEIETLQPSTVDDILQFVPGVEMTGGPRRTGEVPSIRGFDGADVIVLFDGTRQNFGSAHDGRFFIDPALLSSVEVLRGASSSLYGSGGTGGVIEFRTVNAGDFLDPDETFGIRTSVGYQNVNVEKFGSLTAYAQPGYGLDVVANLTYRDSGDIELGSGQTLDSDDEILAGLAKVGWSFAEDHFLEASYIGYGGQVQEPNNAQGLGSDDNVDKDISADTFRLAYSYDNPSNPWINLDAIAYYTGTSNEEQRLDNLGLGPAGELLERDVSTLGFRVDNRSRYDFSEASQALFTYGVEYYRDVQNGEQGGAAWGGVPDADSDSLGAFAQAELTFTELHVLPGEFLLVPGVRFDYYRIDSDVADGTRETAVSPRIAATYKPVPWLMGFASWGKAFRAPTFNEMFLTGTHFQIPLGPGATVDNFFVPNPDLKPQRTTTLEFGGGVEFDSVIEDGDRFQAKASYYMTDGEDFIALDVDQPTPFVDCNPFIPGACDGTTTSRNVAEAELSGFELESGYESRRFKAFLGVSTVDGKDAATGDYIGLLAPPQVTAGFAVKLPEISSIVGWRGIFAGKFDETNDPDEERDPYQVHDLYFSYEPKDELLNGVRLDLGVDNIFDQDYSRTYTGASEPGRNFKAMISYKLNF